MSEKFELIKSYLNDLELEIVDEDPEEELVVIDDEENGIKNFIIDCEDSILVMEQVIMDTPQEPGELYKRLLQINRELIHGAFVLDDEGKKIIFRDTLQLENLDCNELEGSINALSLALAEFSTELLTFIKA